MESGEAAGTFRDDTVKEKCLPGSTDDIECSICYSDFWNPVETPCNHVFCQECINVWLLGRNTCPMCRADLSHWAVKSETGHRWELTPEQLALVQLNEMAQLERDSMRQEQERLMAVVPEGKAVVLRIGHRKLGDNPVHELYVETVDKGPCLTLGGLIQEVRFQSLNPQAVTGPDRVRAPGKDGIFSVWWPFDKGIDPYFKVHIVWKAGLGIRPLSVTVRSCLTGRCRACRCVAVELPDAANISGSALLRRDLEVFSKALSARRRSPRPRRSTCRPVQSLP